MKGQRSLVPTLFSPISDSQTLSVIQILAVKDWRQNCTKRSFFNIEDNYKCNANEASHTSLLFGRLLNTHNVGNFRTGTFKVRKRRLKLIESCHNRVHGTCSLRYSITFMWKALCLKIEKIYMSYTCHVFSFEDKSGLLQRMPCGVQPMRGRILPKYPCVL